MLYFFTILFSFFLTFSQLAVADQSDAQSQAISFSEKRNWKTVSLTIQTPTRSLEAQFGLGKHSPCTISDVHHHDQAFTIHRGTKVNGFDTLTFDEPGMETLELYSETHSSKTISETQILDKDHESLLTIEKSKKHPAFRFFDSEHHLLAEFKLHEREWILDLKVVDHASENLMVGLCVLEIQNAFIANRYLLGTLTAAGITVAVATPIILKILLSNNKTTPTPTPSNSTGTSLASTTTDLKDQSSAGSSSISSSTASTSEQNLNKDEQKTSEENKDRLDEEEKKAKEAKEQLEKSQEEEKKRKSEEKNR